MSVVGIALEEVRSGIIPINPTIIRVMRVLRIARGSVATQFGCGGIFINRFVANLPTNLYAKEFRKSVKI